MTSRVTTFDDDLTPVVEERETPDLDRSDSESPDWQSPYWRSAAVERVEGETPDSVDEVTTSCTVQRHSETAEQTSPDDEHMDVHRSSSDSDPDSRRLHGI